MGKKIKLLATENQISRELDLRPKHIGFKASQMKFKGFSGPTMQFKAFLRQPLKFKAFSKLYEPSSSGENFRIYSNTRTAVFNFLVYISKDHPPR